MKYGLVYFRNSVNIGDAIQTYAIHSLYKEMGIQEDDIVKIDLEELASYSGEYVILPMNTFSHLETLQLSKKIIPLYIGYNNTLYLNPEDISQLKTYEPIGCRDEYTMQNMHSFGIQSFLTGCYTLTLPKRDNEHKREKIFLVDAPKTLVNYIPDNLKNNIVYTSHIISSRITEELDTSQKFHDYAVERLKTYANEAALIVTGRLHCASPCLALGIPVIIVKQNIDINLSWIDKFLPIYTEEHFSEINWNPGAIDLENHKSKMKALFMSRMEEMVKKYQLYTDLSYCYEIRIKSDYNFKLKKRLKWIIKKLGTKHFTYSIWGCGPGGMLAHQLIQEYCPEAELLSCVDKYKRGVFYGVSILPIERASELTSDIILICTYAGRADAVTILNSIHKIREKDFTFFLSKDNCQDEYFHGYNELEEGESS